jgi:small-conductance mechanosensitive channel
MEQLMELLEISLFGNTVSRYLYALLTYLAMVLALRIVEKIIIRRLKHLTHGENQKHGAFFIGLFEETVVPVLYFGAFYFAAIQLVLPGALGSFLHAIWIIVLSFQATRLAVTLVMFLVEDVWMKRHKQPEKVKPFRSILNILKITIWGIAGVFVLDNLGFNVSAVVAGLGIGGVAVALAAQTILGDLFNHFVIFFDRPFEEGDFIISDDYMGTIENIGIKSTRIRSLSGEQIVISNTNLTNSRIRNYKRMAERRVVFKIGITYETPLEKVKKIPEIIKAIVQSQKTIRFDRVHMQQFGAYSLDFEIVYFVLNPDYNLYMDIQQNINYAIMEAFQKDEIDFAYPTTVEYLKPLNQKTLD